MDYYRASVTEKSWDFLVKLNREFKFTLIGGWAVWLYTGQLKSKDIDIVIDQTQLARLKNKYSIHKNARLSKYEIKKGEVDVDIYVPYYSNLGIPMETILPDFRIINGFSLPSWELLLALKAVAWDSRKISPKGRKDFLDIIGLFNRKQLDKKAIIYWFGEISGGQKIKENLKQEIKRTVKVTDLGLNEHQMAKFKKIWLEKL